MADDWKTIDGLQRDLSELKRQVAMLASTVAAVGGSIPVNEAMRAAGRQARYLGDQASYLGDEAQRAVRRHPLAASAIAMAALGAVVCLLMYSNEERNDRWWQRR